MQQIEHIFHFLLHSVNNSSWKKLLALVLASSVFVLHLHSNAGEN